MGFFNGLLIYPGGAYFWERFFRDYKSGNSEKTRFQSQIYFVCLALSEIFQIQ